jgi:hypothetical protein
MEKRRGERRRDRGEMGGGRMQSERTGVVSGC